MEAEVSKVFSTIPPSRFLSGLNIVICVIYCLVVSHAFYKEIHPNVLAGLIPKYVELMFVILLVLIVISAILVRKTEIITVTSEAILFQNEKIQLGSIRIIKQLKRSGSDQLLIETDQSKVSLAATLKKEQVNEMFAYILDQIRINYPENYNGITSGHNEVEKFWQN